MHVEEFRRMNADMKIEGRSVIIKGDRELHCRSQQAKGRCISVLLGPVAKAIARHRTKHIDRGLCWFSRKTSRTRR